MLNIDWISPTTTSTGSVLQVNHHPCYCVEEQRPTQPHLNSRSRSPDRICHHQHNQNMPLWCQVVWALAERQICGIKSSILKQITELILLIWPERWNEKSGNSEFLVELTVASWRRICPLLDDECIAPDWWHLTSRNDIDRTGLTWLDTSRLEKILQCLAIIVLAF